MIVGVTMSDWFMVGGGIRGEAFVGGHSVFNHSYG